VIVIGAPPQAKIEQAIKRTITPLKRALSRFLYIIHLLRL